MAEQQYDKKEREKDPAKQPQKPKGLMVFLVVMITAIALLWAGQSLVPTEKVYETTSFTEFINEIDRGNAQAVTLEGYEATAELKEPIARKEGGKDETFKRIRTTFHEKSFGGMEDFERISKKLPDPSNFEYRPPNLFFYQVVLPFIPWLLLIVLIWYFFFRQMRMGGGPGGVLSFGKSRAKFATDDKRKITFSDVAGIDEAKDDVLELIEFLKDKQKFRKLGGRVPRGILLVGPPGTGKTLLAKAIAGEANVPFMSICGSDFVEMFVGVGASRVRDLFQQAKSSSPCIIFLDEIDAVGRRRGTGLGGGHDEREQTLNAILVEMDGFDTDDGVIVIAATNRPDVLDPALLRPGRFDREIVIDLPDVKGREDILKVHARKIKLGAGIDLNVVARSTPGFSGADLEAVINEAALLAAMKKKEQVDLDDLEEARDKVRWGRQKKSKVMDEEDKKITAYHESGHAIIAQLLPEVEPLHKVTIIPRGVALGSTMTLPEKDRYHMSKKYVLGEITLLFGGRVAEEIFCADVCTGARSDIKRATELARSMVCEWGMSDAVGPVSYSETEEHIFLGREISRTRNHSEQLALEIDREVRKIIDGCHERARDLILGHREACDRIARELIKREVLTAAEVRKIMAGEPLPEPPAKPPSPQKQAAPETEKKPEWKPKVGGEPLTGPAQA